LVSSPVYKVHPALGVARVGNSEDYYVAPATAGGLPINPDGRRFQPADFRDGDGRLRRQAARFEVFRHESADAEDPGRPVRPGRDGIKAIEWTVHLANKKAAWYRFIVNAGADGYAPDHPVRNPEVTGLRARQRLIIDPGPRTLTGPRESRRFSPEDNPEHYPVNFPRGNLKPHRIETLGAIATDEESRLLVLGGFGHSGSDRDPPVADNYANNDGWWDDTADGPVVARLSMDDGRVIAVDGGAWALVAPPRFAPQLVNVVTLYDTMFDVAVRAMGLRPEMYADGLWNRDYRPSFKREVLPILERITRYRWVAAIPRHAHDLDLDKLGDPRTEFRGLREFYLSLVRPPDKPNLYRGPDSGMPLMPMLCGDNCFVAGPLASAYLTLTRTQYFALSQWAAGSFTTDEAPMPSGAAALDRAALENCVGGAFSPGIEATWISRNPSIYAEPFRVRGRAGVKPPLSLGQDFSRGLEPGDLSKYMALPWQADFNECSGELVGDRYAFWWPVQRPDHVHIRRRGKLVQVAWVGSEHDANAADYLEFAKDTEMVERWWELGFVYNVGSAKRPKLIEVERRLPREDV
jgi:L-Lysine epsilon oxidase N-terminal/L-lysine epsilon oxidase C-terminal domain